ncbi:hypothetical protein ABZ921_00710 [Streptomyces atriruber]|uniref:Uncharacterized protein n=1 Tax=Streptomyces atriruber TaxID=545121 RepID=A0ABV3BDT8_9ACTN
MITDDARAASGAVRHERRKEVSPMTARHSTQHPVRALLTAARVHSLV